MVNHQEITSFTSEFYKEIMKNEYELLKLTKSFSFVRNNLKLDFPRILEEEEIDKNEKKYKVELTNFISYIDGKEINYQEAEEKFKVDILKKSLNLIKELFDSMNSEDDIFNFFSFLCSKIKKNYKQKFSYVFALDRTNDIVKEEIKSLLFKNFVFYEPEDGIFLNYKIFKFSIFPSNCLKFALVYKNFKNGKKTMSNAYCESIFNDTCFLNSHMVFGDKFDSERENCYFVRIFILIIHELAHRLRFQIGCDENVFIGSPFLNGINQVSESSSNKNKAEIGHALENLLMGVIFDI